MSLVKAVVLTRPEPANSEFANALKAKSPHANIVKMPLAEYVPTREILPDLGDYDAGIVTSKAALRMVDLDFSQTKWVVVGAQSANHIRANGGQVIAEFATASELVEGLQNLSEQKFLYLRGRAISADLARIFSAQDVHSRKIIDEIIVYEIKMLSDADCSLIADYDALIMPIFSRESYLRVLENWDKIPNKFISLLPISKALAAFISENLPIGAGIESVLEPPGEPTRLNFIDKIAELI